MPRILALADTQLGVQTVDLADQAKVLARIASLAIEREVDVVLHGGDVFEGRSEAGALVSPEQTRVFLDFARDLRSDGIPLVVVTGNGRHDSAMRSVHALDVFHEIENVEVHDRPGVTEHADVGIVTLPWVHPGNLIAQANGNVDRDQINDYASKLLVQIAGELLEKSRAGRTDLPYLVPPAERAPEHHVLLAHWAISGSALPTGLPVDQMREPVLSWADLDALGFDAVIGAHVHEPQQISQPLIDKTLGIVVGSPQQLNFGERGDHGVWIVEVGDGQAAAEFVPIESKRFLTIAVASPDALYSIPWGIAEGDIVRVLATATEQEMRVWNQEGVREAMLREGASRVDIKPQIVRANRARAATMSEELSPVEALVLYCENEKIEEGLARRMGERLQEWVA